jgi:hypothetical protein
MSLLMGLKWSSEAGFGVMVMSIGAPMLDTTNTSPKQQDVTWF